MSASASITPTLDALAQVAVFAGAEIMRIYAGDVTPHAKSDGSPVTLADEAAEAIIGEGLRAVSAIPIVAEEAVSAGHAPQKSDIFFLVDPLDGTKEFVSRNGEFTVNIALIEDGRPVMGVVLAPALGVLYAGDGSGAWRAKTDALGVRDTLGVRPAPEALKVVASRSHLTNETRQFVERFSVDSFVSSGSSLKFCQVAEGTADLYPRLGRTMEWDTAAGDAVLRAAGGRVLTMDGTALTYGKCWPDEAGDTFANPHFVACGAFDPFATP